MLLYRLGWLSLFLDVAYMADFLIAMDWLFMSPHNLNPSVAAEGETALGRFDLGR